MAGCVDAIGVVAVTRGVGDRDPLKPVRLVRLCFKEPCIASCRHIHASSNVSLGSEPTIVTNIWARILSRCFSLLWNPCMVCSPPGAAGMVSCELQDVILDVICELPDVIENVIMVSCELQDVILDVILPWFYRSVFNNTTSSTNRALVVL